MNPEIETLKTILTHQEAIYADVEDRIQQKRKVLIEGDVHQLAGIDQELATLGQQVTRLEQERLELLTRMGYADKPLSEVIARLPVEEASHLRELRIRLRARIDNVRTANDQARSLLDLSIKWIEDTVEVIAKAVMPEATSYGQQNGKCQPGKGPDGGTIIPSTIQRNA